MASFKSRNDYGDFARHVKTVSRHVRDENGGHFLEALLETVAGRTNQCPKGTGLWRAQLDCATRMHAELEDVLLPCACPPERMKPLAEKAKEGRVNAKGIPVLYLSTDRNNAMAETRPWIGSHVSLGQFVTMRDLLFVDFTNKEKKPGVYLNEGHRTGTTEERETNNWWHVNQAFSEPVTAADDVADYAPTQVIAEWFRHNRFDGIVYGSKLGVGLNVAIFDPSDAKLVQCVLHQVTSISFDFGDPADDYSIKGMSSLVRYKAQGALD